MSECAPPMEWLEPESGLGKLVSDSLQRQTKHLGGPMADPELWRIPGGVHNATVLAHDTDSGHRVICRRPLQDIEPDTALYRERHIHTILPESVSPQSYCLDAHNPNRPIHILQYIAGTVMPYDAWPATATTGFAAKLARAHVPLDQQPTDLMAYLMRYDLHTRMSSIQTTESRQLSHHVLAATKSIAARAQSLFGAPETVLAHNDLQASNIILDHTGETWLWDWEFGGPLHPDLELGAVYYPGEGVAASSQDQGEDPGTAAPNEYAISSEMMELNEEQERAFIAAYEAVAGDTPARLDRIRTSQCINLGRIVMVLTARGDAHLPGKVPDALLAERDRLYDVWAKVCSAMGA